MRALLYGDIQISKRRPQYMEFLTKTLEYLVSLIEEHKPDLVVNLGDTIDTFGSVEAEDLVYAYRAMSRISEAASSVSGAEHWVIKGNHDAADRAGEFSAIYAFQDIKGLTVFEKPRIVSGAFVLPWVGSHEKVHEAVNEVEDKEISVVLSHVEWKGCRMSPTFVSPDGLDPAEFSKNRPKAKVFNGHYHQPDVVGPIILVGSPLYKDFSDVEGKTPRGFCLVDKKVTRIENPHTYKCVNVSIDGDDFSKLDELLESNPKSLRVKVFAPKKQLKNLSNYSDRFLWFAAYANDSDKTSVESFAGVKINSTTEDIINRAVESAPAELNKNRLFEIGKEIFS